MKTAGRDAYRIHETRQNHTTGHWGETKRNRVAQSPASSSTSVPQPHARAATRATTCRAGVSTAASGEMLIKLLQLFSTRNNAKTFNQHIYLGRNRAGKKNCPCLIEIDAKPGPNPSEATGWSSPRDWAEPKCCSFQLSPSQLPWPGWLWGLLHLSSCSAHAHCPASAQHRLIAAPLHLLGSAAVLGKPWGHGPGVWPDPSYTFWSFTAQVTWCYFSLVVCEADGGTSLMQTAVTTRFWPLLWCIGWLWRSYTCDTRDTCV